jgi:hypothetical protein
MNELTFDDACRKYNFNCALRQDYIRVREVLPDKDNVGALFAYCPPKDGYVTIDLYVTRNGNVEPGVGDLNCRVEHADDVIDAIADGDIERLNQIIFSQT